MVSDSPQNNGWDANCNFQWSEEIYSEEVVSFLTNSASTTFTCEEDGEDFEENDIDLEEDNVNDIFEIDEDLDEEEYS